MSARVTTTMTSTVPTKEPVPRGRGYERPVAVAGRVVSGLPGVAWHTLPAAMVLEHSRPSPGLHIARGWHARPCPTCKAQPGDPCRTPSRRASKPHVGRLRVGRFELVRRDDVWAELERRGATMATVPFSGRAGLGGTVGTITLSRFGGGEVVDVERWSGRDELAYALEAPVWDRFGQFNGHPRVRGTVTWLLADRLVLIAGERGDMPFEEIVQ